MTNEAEGAVERLTEAMNDAIADHEDDVARAWEAGERPDLWDAPDVTVSIPDLRALLAALRAQAERVRVLEGETIALDRLPFWPWLWANPFMDAPGEHEAATERRVRANYETARAPVPDQYAILHRADIQRLVHALWRKRALQSVLEGHDAHEGARHRPRDLARSC